MHSGSVIRIAPFSSVRRRAFTIVISPPLIGQWSSRNGTNARRRSTNREAKRRPSRSRNDGLDAGQDDQFRPGLARVVRKRPAVDAIQKPRIRSVAFERLGEVFA